VKLELVNPVVFLEVFKSRQKKFRKDLPVAGIKFFLYKRNPRHQCAHCLGINALNGYAVGDGFQMGIQGAALRLLDKPRHAAYIADRKKGADNYYRAHHCHHYLCPKLQILEH